MSQPEPLMGQPDDEERLLRAVGIQNAEAILVARRRAEEELLRAKEALELRTGELAHSLAMARATLESTTDGILVTDDWRDAAPKIASALGLAS